MRNLLFLTPVVLCLALLNSNRVQAQVYGHELHNSVMPASGGMAGTSFSRPQDLQSAINGNPATMTQFAGTQFGFGGAFGEATYNVTQTAPLPLVGVTPFTGLSDTPGSILGNIGVIHETYMMGMPVHLGMAFVTNAGLGVDFRPIPESNGTHSSYLALDTINSAAFKVTDRFSVGTSVTIGTSIMDGPFVASSSSQTAYAPRFTVGGNYELGNGVSAGAFWQSKKNLLFDNVARFPGGSFQDVSLDHPVNIGFGLANRCLMNGRLLLAADAIFKDYSNADFFRSLYDDQWVFQLGAQYQLNPRLKVRAGYAFNEDPMLDTVPGSIGGVIPVGGIPAVQYIQGQFASLSQHRLTGGAGIADVMPGVDFDMHLGGMFDGERSFGATTASVESYWIGFGFTWHCRPATACNCHGGTQASTGWTE